MDVIPAFQPSSPGHALSGAAPGRARPCAAALRLLASPDRAGGAALR